VDHYRWLERAGPRGLWTVLGARDPFGHPAPFSSRLVHDLLELFSFREDLVGDPFVGTGTTPAVCVQMGRQFVASDRSPRYVAQARARVAQALKSRGAA
jgi:site-specific DNA-methyltransferase (adenine-specific)